MGYWCGAIVETKADELKGSEAFPFHAVHTEPGCDWVAIHDYFFEDEPPNDLAVLSKDLGRRVLAFCGHTATDWLHLRLFENGECVRLLEFSQDGWRVEGDAVQPWESHFVAKLADSGRSEDEMLPAEKAIKETGRLQTGALFPICTDNDFSDALRLGGLPWGGGEKVVTREKRGFFSRIFGR